MVGNPYIATPLYFDRPEAKNPIKIEYYEANMKVL
jgi:hypothetical protein